MVKVRCKYCNKKNSHVKSPFCSKRCYNDWRYKNIPGLKEHKNKVQREYSREKYVKKGYKRSPEYLRNHSKIKMGKLNPNWNDYVGFSGLHTWVKRNKPKSMFCEKCGKVTNKLDCANISGEYKRDISDFRWLCRKCHMGEDGRLNRLIELAYKRKGIFKKYFCKYCGKKVSPHRDKCCSCAQYKRYNNLCVNKMWKKQENKPVNYNIIK